MAHKRFHHASSTTGYREVSNSSHENHKNTGEYLPIKLVAAVGGGFPSVPFTDFADILREDYPAPVPAEELCNWDLVACDFDRFEEQLLSWATRE